MGLGVSADLGVGAAAACHREAMESPPRGESRTFKAALPPARDRTNT